MKTVAVAERGRPHRERMGRMRPKRRCLSIVVAGPWPLRTAVGSTPAAFDEGVAHVLSATDLAYTDPVQYSGIHTDVFREGLGVVAAGRLGQDGVFKASEVLAKQDGTCLPPETAVALKDGGHWPEGADP